MKLLLDTCVFLWLTVRPAQLSRAATAALNDSSNDLFLSDVSVWEMVLKHALGKLPMPEAPRLWIPKQAAIFHLDRVVIDEEVMFRSGELPQVHHDPIDRLLAAQALTNSLHLVSPDKPFRGYGVNCIW